MMSCVPSSLLFLCLVWHLLFPVVGIATPSEKEPPHRVRQREVIQAALGYIGSPYAWGGNTAKGIDCSGLMVQSFRTIGVSLPRHSGDQAKEGYAIARADVQPGDMVFFSKKGKVFHVGLVMRVEAGDAWFIHASSSRGVIVSRLNQPGWKRRFHDIRRMWKTPKRQAPPAKLLVKAVDQPPFSPYLTMPKQVASERRLSRGEAFVLGPRNRREMQADLLAKYGYQFPGFPDVKAHYDQFDWYRAQLRITQAEVIFELMSPTERYNLRLLAQFD